MIKIKTNWNSSYKQNLRQFYQNKKVLIVGADGFLGSHCAIMLRELNPYITVLTRRRKSRVSDYADNIVYGDLSNLEVANDLVRNQDVIFDFAGKTGAVESNSDSYKNFQIECQPHLNLFKSCADLNPGAILLFCSSRLVYGKPTYLPVDEDHPLAPESLYAVHKITLENYLKVFSKISGLRSSIIRLSNPYGSNIEKKPYSYGLLNLFIQKALSKEPITVFGDGNQYRDFIHVRDVVSAFLSCAANKQCHGEVFNLGGNTKIQINNVAQMITRLANSTPVEYIEWPQEHKLIETGDYYTNLDKLNSRISLPEQFSFPKTIKEMVAVEKKAFIRKPNLEDHFQTGGLSYEAGI